MRIGLVVVLVLASCEDSTPLPDAATEFDYQATLFWWSVEMPEIVSVAIDDAPLQDGEQYKIEQRFTSYDDAVANFRPRRVTVTVSLDAYCGQCVGHHGEVGGWCDRARTPK